MPHTSLAHDVTVLLKQAGAEIVKFVDLALLPSALTKGYPVAILIGIPLSSGYLNKVANVSNYVQDMKCNNLMHEDEFHNMELKTDGLADFIADYLAAKGYRAYSQSEKNLLATGAYNTSLQSTLLPHKTIALLAGMGWIGRHNLLVTPECGSAISMCTVLTNAPLPAECSSAVPSQCNDCTVCVGICPASIIKGKAWSRGIPRDEMIDAKGCITCLRCMVFCPWTCRYVRQGIKRKQNTCN